MNPLPQHIAEIEEAFDEKFTPQDFDFSADNTEIISFLRQSLTAIVLKTLEEVEERIGNLVTEFREIESDEYDAGAKRLKRDALTTLTEIRKQLK